MKKGPGPEAMENHEALADRLASLCADFGVTYSKRTVIGETPYKLPFTADLVLRNLPDYPEGLGVIARYQGVSGSADQKLIFVAFSVRRSTVPCVIVLDGEGWPDGALSWIRGQIAGKLLNVWTVQEFGAFISLLREG